MLTMHGDALLDQAAVAVAAAPRRRPRRAAERPRPLPGQGQPPGVPGQACPGGRGLPASGPSR